MHKKFEVNQIKIKGGCQSCSEVATHDSWRDLTLALQNFEDHRSHNWVYVGLDVLIARVCLLRKPSYL